LQVRAQLVLDLLCFCPRSRQTEQHIICIADISESSVGGIDGIS
jgi:hypothetical protein